MRKKPHRKQLFKPRVSTPRRLHGETSQNVQDSYCYEYEVTVAEIPDIVSELQASNVDTAFAVLMFSPPAPKKLHDPVVNLQYAIQGGVVGLEWVLLGPRNCDDKERLVEFIKEMGHQVEHLEINDVEYLRVLGDDVATLGIQIISNFYHVDATERLGLLTSWFQYRQKDNGDTNIAIGNPHRYRDV